MGIFDNVTSAVNRGTESAGRAAEKMKIKNQISEINKRRSQLAAQLGTSLYDATRNDPALRVGREQLYDGIAACDAERAACNQRLNELEFIQESIETFRCSICGAKVTGSDLFCSGCGAPIAQARPATMPAPMANPVSSTFCGNCGAAMAPDDAFCMSCGTPVAPAAAATGTPAPVVEVVVEDSNALTDESGDESKNTEGE